MSLHYAWCASHQTFVADDSGSVFDFCESHRRVTGGAEVKITSGGQDDVPSIEVYGDAAFLTAQEARLLASALTQAADELDAAPLPDVSRIDT